jgi:hypothetical protein
MSFAKKSFDWRSFWADLLGTAGRGLLELDNSEVADAALTGLNFMEAGRRRRRDDRLEEGANAELNHAMRTHLDASSPDLIAEDSDGELAEGESNHRIIESARQMNPSWRLFGSLQTGLPASVRPVPLSVDPYDDPSLPAWFRAAQYYNPRRR